MVSKREPREPVTRLPKLFSKNTLQGTFDAIYKFGHLRINQQGPSRQMVTGPQTKEKKMSRSKRGGHPEHVQKMFADRKHHAEDMGERYAKITSNPRLHPTVAHHLASTIQSTQGYSFRIIGQGRWQGEEFLSCEHRTLKTLGKTIYDVVMDKAKGRTTYCLGWYAEPKWEPDTGLMQLGCKAVRTYKIMPEEEGCFAIRAEIDMPYPYQVGHAGDIDYFLTAYELIEIHDGRLPCVDMTGVSYTQEVR